MNRKNLYVVLISCVIGVVFSTTIFSTTFANEKMDPCVGSKSGPVNTLIWFHDNNNDGKADYKATYAFINGKLKLLKKEDLKIGEFKSPINPKPK